MNYIFIDTETVDLAQNTSRPINDIDNWPPIRQIAWIICDENRNIIERHNYVTGPIHSIDDSVENYCPQESKPIHKILPILMQALDSCVYLIGHNISFDANVIAAELYRYGYDTSLIEDIPQICTMRNSVDFCDFAGRTDARFPKLQELYTKIFHEPFINAHDAYCDIFATFKCFWALVDKDIISKSDYEDLYTEKERIDLYDEISTTVDSWGKSHAIKDKYGVMYSADGKRLISAQGLFYYGILKGTYTIPDGVEAICDDAFGNSKELTKLIIPKSVKKIGASAFALCNGLLVICHSPYFSSIISKPYGHDLYDTVNDRIIAFFDYPGGVIHCSSTYSYPESYYTTVQVENTNKGHLVIGDSAFRGSNIEHITIGDGVSTSRFTFYMCRQLKSISLPDTMTEMPDHFLNDCKNLQSINFPQRLKRIGEASLMYCVKLKIISLPKSVSEIGEYAFQCCEGLEKISIPESVKHISSYTFAHCDNLKEFDIKSSVERIDFNPFRQCFKLKIHGSERFVFRDGALYDEVEKRLISYIGTDSSYSVCNGTLVVGNGAFFNCMSLISIELPESIISIGDEAFYGCENLQSIHIPPSITTIKRKTFYYCKSINQLTIPKSVTVIEDSAFYNCSSMTDIYFSNPSTKLHGDNPFLSCDSLQNIYVPEGTMDQFYKNFSHWGSSKRNLIREPGFKGALKRWKKNR